MLTMLEELKKSREILEATYVPWFADDYKGGHCALGAVQIAIGNEFATQSPCWLAVENAAKRLYPELKGRIKPRLANGVGYDDYFYISPAIFVNNQLGKEAILKVFDEAIQHEELRLLCEEEAKLVNPIQLSVEEDTRINVGDEIEVIVK